MKLFKKKEFLFYKDFYYFSSSKNLPIPIKDSNEIEWCQNDCKSN